MSCLHILNGEGTAVNFRKSGIRGDIVVWNEALVSGPIISKVGSRKFWHLRQEYFDRQLPNRLAMPQTLTYQQVVLSEFQKLEELHQYDQVVLWFEHDLFCQINLMALLSWMTEQPALSANIELVSIHEFHAVADFRGMGQLAPHHFLELEAQKTTLQPPDLQFAHQAWITYAGTNPQDLATLTAPSAFPYWEQAVLHHLSRFPSTFNGLGDQQQRIVEYLEEQPMSEKSLIRKLLLQSGWWGFGDLQFLEILHTLDPLLDRKELLQLNAQGLEVLKGTMDYLEIARDPFPLGGVMNDQFRWNGAALIPQHPGP